MKDLIFKENGDKLNSEELLKIRIINLFTSAEVSYGFSGPEIYDYLVEREIIPRDEVHIKIIFKQVINDNTDLIKLLKIKTEEYSKNKTLINKTKSACLDVFFQKLRSDKKDIIDLI